ncbi:MAG: hypothetical protein KKA65_03970 [Nanoarchaeota archaeon]|nr:hypothetical protein [Nanoarchaeota archaeon]MBU4242229.1 hypothetical protein [Nanoarchaeota archaeon]MBU4351593.1 hypothetical protein [Nanoarchaeota archaeon]MBU4456634.1 hypothetical protein [Nanoarchaeota archaeon]MCG2719507.1 hypothetical protein [Nanoarchaeota archaeon]
MSNDKKSYITPDEWIHSDKESDELFKPVQEPSEGIVAAVQEACRKAAGIEIKLDKIGYQTVVDGLISDEEANNYFPALGDVPQDAFDKKGYKIEKTSKKVIAWRTSGKPNSFWTRFKEYFLGK